MKTLYTGHVTIGTHDVYSFIYAETLLEAEEYLTSLLKRYMQSHHTPSPAFVPEVKVVSRPGGWNPPDGYYLPGTSTLYALKYATQQSTAPQRATLTSQPAIVDQDLDVPQSQRISRPSEVLPRS